MIMWLNRRLEEHIKWISMAVWMILDAFLQASKHSIPTEGSRIDKSFHNPMSGWGLRLRRSRSNLFLTNMIFLQIVRFSES